MVHIEKLDVYISDSQVGTLAMYKNSVAAFQYGDDWIESGFAIDPLHLPLSNKIYIPEYRPFEGLFGVFNDSLPDGWGLLLLNRMLASKGINLDELNPLDKLSIIGNTGMGALEYKPINDLKGNNINNDLDEIATESLKIFESQPSNNLDDVYNAGGSSGGARPKALVKINNEDWIVKFPSSLDAKNIAQMEFDYCTCAKNCEIEIPEIKLLPSKRFKHFFAIKRFDRVENQKIHKISASSLLNTSHRIPAMDYNNLTQATWAITKDINELKKVYRLMCFNVFSHNRDDHSNNFSFIFKKGKWHFAPAYDLTYSSSLNGEHATTINGEGKNPTIDDILAVAKNASLDLKWAKNTAENIEAIVKENLSNYIN